MPQVDLEEVKSTVEESLVGSMNFYASQNEMVAATAIHDAYLCLAKALEEKFPKDG